MTDDTAVRDLLVAKELGHPFGRRATDPQLRLAVEKGHTGLLKSPASVSVDIGSLADGHQEALMRDKHLPNFLRGRRYRRAVERATTERTHRRWPLRRTDQADQGDRPICVAATEVNWERSRPVENRSGLGMETMYAKAKLVDGAPAEDGTTSDAMISVCQDLGLVEQAFRYDGSIADKVALVRWLLDVSSVWWGCGWPESAFRTRLDPVSKVETGLIDPVGPCIYGHEVLILGYENFRRLGPAFVVANWPQWGVLGRGWVLEADFWRWMDAGEGDLLGVLEKRTT